MPINMYNIIKLLAVGVIFIWSVEIYANTICNIDSTDINFGEVHTLEKNSVGNVRITCTNSSNTPQNINYVIKFHYNDSHKLKNGGKFLFYKLYKDNNCTQDLGDDNDSLKIAGGFSLRAGERIYYDIPIYAKLFVPKILTVGNYAGLVTAILEY